MISTSGRKILERFVGDVKSLLMNNIISLLQQHYGIWADGNILPEQQLATKDSEIIYRARMLRQRIQYIKNNLPADSVNRDAKAVMQLTSEQAFTIINRFCAVRMCEERGLIAQSIGGGYESEGFISYDMVTGQGAVGSRFERYCWFLQSLFDELSIELPAVFDRFSPYGLMSPDETTMNKLFELVNAKDLTAYYDSTTGETVDFWKEDETLGWIFQYYNSLEERRRMRDESNKPRNSREMAVRNQFFTPDYVVRFLTDNSLGRIWYEMTGGCTAITNLCRYMVRREGEVIPHRAFKEPTELAMLDPACGSMHFGLYSFDVMEAIYMDAWDNQESMLEEYRYKYTREQFAVLVPKLILENNIYGTEIDPRALQIAALSLWLRAQQSWSRLEVPREERPVIERSHLVLAEPMPGSKKMFHLLTEQLEAPMQRLILKIWEKMQYVGEAGLLIKMEQEIASEIEDLRKNWSRINKSKEIELFDSEDKKAAITQEHKQMARLNKKEAKTDFFSNVVERLQEALQTVSSRLSEDEGYENSLFANDAVRGFAFIELCQKRFDVILMNPPFGEGSESTSEYLDDNYPNWCRNLVCAFFDRMQEMLQTDGLLGVIFDRVTLIKSSYEIFRRSNVCGFIKVSADTGWGVLDASVETSTFVMTKFSSNQNGVFFNINDIAPDNKDNHLLRLLVDYHNKTNNRIYICQSIEFEKLPNSITGYYFDKEIIAVFQNTNILERNFKARQGYTFVAPIHYRLFYELTNNKESVHLYGGGRFSQFYIEYRDLVNWINNGDAAKAHNSFRNSSGDVMRKSGVGFGKRGDIVDAHILKNNFFFNAEGLAIPNISEHISNICLSFINTIISQYNINLYTTQHKQAGNMNLLPMPDYESRQSDIERIVNEIIMIKRQWFSLDETNLEYHGLIAQLGIKDSIENAHNEVQSMLTTNYNRYEELVKDNDDLWMDLADIDRNCDFRQTLNDYKSRRPYEELISIDGGSSKNVLNRKVMAQEIVQELVGMAFGRWDMAYAKHTKDIPAFGDVFDALPFMPMVTLETGGLMNYDIDLPMDGLLIGNADHPLSIVKRIQQVMQCIWGKHADDFDYEICKLIGVENLQDYFDSPTGFFDYHFKRYTKSRRKAPIYWPVSSPQGDIVIWMYYPRLSDQTLPHILLMLSKECTALQSELRAAQLANDKKREAQLLTSLGEIESLETELSRVHRLPYKPNHDDGIPVTAAPLVNVFRHTGWKNECAQNMEALESGEYDWSHLAYSFYPSRIREKVKIDWCLALTHGLEELCENKPKPKNARKKKADETPESDLFNN